MKFTQTIENEIRDKKRKGVLNSELMKEYNLRYWELREILDNVQTMRLFDVTKNELGGENNASN